MLLLTPDTCYKGGREGGKEGRKEGGREGGDREMDEGEGREGGKGVRERWREGRG